MPHYVLVFYYTIKDQLDLKGTHTNEILIRAHSSKRKYKINIKSVVKPFLVVDHVTRAPNTERDLMGGAASGTIRLYNKIY